MLQGICDQGKISKQTALNARGGEERGENGKEKKKNHGKT